MVLNTIAVTPNPLELNTIAVTPNPLEYTDDHEGSIFGETKQQDEKHVFSLQSNYDMSRKFFFLSFFCVKFNLYAIDVNVTIILIIICNIF